MLLTFRTESSAPDHRVVVAAGELDMASSGHIRQELLAVIADPGVGVVGVDLRAVTFIDSSGIGALIVAHNAAERVGKRFAVERASEQVVQMLQLIGADKSLGLTA